MARQKPSYGDLKDQIRRLEERLKKKEQEDFLEHAFKHSAIGMAQVLPDGKFILVNRKFCDIIGYSAGELYKMTFRDITHPGDLHLDEVQIKKVIAGQIDNYQIEKRYIHKAGHHVWVRLFTNAIRDQKGEVLYAVANAIEITDLKNTEEDLRASENKYRQLAENISDIIWEVDRNGVCTYMSPRIKDILGYEPHEVIGRKPFDIMDDFESQKIRQTFEQFVKQEKPFENLINCVKARDGRTVVLETSGTPVFNETGKLIGYRGTDRDITQRRFIENALKESEERFRLLSDFTFEGIIIHKRGVLMDANKSFEMLTGYAVEEAKGRKLFEALVSKEDFQKAAENIKKDHAKPYRVKIKRKDGTIFWAEIEGRDIIYKGEKIRIVAVRDITEKVKIEEALTHSEEKYRYVISNSQEGIFVVLNGSFAYTNPAVEKLTGYSYDNLRKKKFVDFIHPDDRDRVVNNYKRRMAGEHIPSYDLRIIDKNNKYVWMHLNATKIKWEGMDAVLCFVTDIDFRKNAEIALKDSEERYQTILHTAMDGLILSDMEANIVEVSDAYCRMSGYTKEELVKMNIRDLDAKFSDKEFNRHAQEFIQKGSLRFESLHHRKDGSVYPVDISASFRKKGHDYSVIFVRDITMQKKASEALKEALRKAEESDRLKSAFLANMSHEIRTPMNGILGFADLLKEPNLSGEEKGKFISMIEKSGERMLNIINDLINISKIEAGQMEVEHSETNVNEILDYLATFFKPEVERKRLKLSVISPMPVSEAVLFTDREKLYAILTNLVKNAIKYTDKGSIAVGYYFRGRNIEFFVKDTGIGIPEDKEHEIFDRFTQINISTSSKYEGAGLGLSIAKAYVELLNGKIWLKSTEGAGSTFYFSIPAGKDCVLESTGEPGDATAFSAKIPKDLTVIIAEDDEAADLYLTKIFSDLKQRVIHANNGKDAVELCRKHPDTGLILMDIKMPEMDGYEATRKIREFNMDVIIIAQTAYALAGDREKAIAAGCNDYIAKPINRNVLFKIIEKNFAGSS